MTDFLSPKFPPLECGYGPFEDGRIHFYESEPGKLFPMPLCGYAGLPVDTEGEPKDIGDLEVCDECLPKFCDAMGIDREAFRQAMMKEQG